MSATDTLPSFTNRPIGEIAASLPGATAVFRKFGLDFCCGGDEILAQAAHAHGLDPEVIDQELSKLQPDPLNTPSSQETPVLIDFILSRYHETHRRELPELVALAHKVEAVHAEHPKVPRGLADLLQRLMGEMAVHMKKEELILFPAMMNGAGGMLLGPISMMRQEHDEHGENLRRLEQITNNFTPPEGACRSWQALYTGTGKLTTDLMEHIHLENYVLFPRFLSGE